MKTDFHASHPIIAIGLTLVAIGYFQAALSQCPATNSVVSDVLRTSVIPRDTCNSLLNRARAHYLNADVSYLNNTGILGVGVVNPKDFSFTLLLDTLVRQQIQIADIETQDYIVPLLNKPDYLIFYVTVKAIYTDYYEIYLNKAMTAFVKKDEFTFYRWPDFLMSTLSIGAKIGFTDRNNQKSVTYFDESITFKVQRVEGAWLLARKILGEDGMLSDTQYWIKWEDEGNLLIRPYLLM